MNSILRRSERVALSGLFVLGVTHAASAQQPTDKALGAAPAVVIVNVNLIPMDRDRLEPGQTVVVQGDRIAAIGAGGEVVVSEAAMVIDAPLYLANGITTVVNLGGGPTGGLTPYEAIRAATVAPAVFLRKDREFGSLGVGKRADLLLLEGNPLQGVAHLKQLVGVIVRGKWLPSEHLHRMLADMVAKE
jgi:imidazolonepropionase-like amidohydrolase